MKYIFLGIGWFMKYVVGFLLYVVLQILIFLWYFDNKHNFEFKKFVDSLPFSTKNEGFFPVMIFFVLVCTTGYFAFDNILPPNVAHPMRLCFFVELIIFGFALIAYGPRRAD